jgi:hypothetical protein
LELGPGVNVIPVRIVALTVRRNRTRRPFMSENMFPSGPWLGFYNYEPGDRHRMDLHLDFANGRVIGDGNDDVGRFLVRGSYDISNGECYWTKTYPGSHDVFYRGFREGKGIWGTWEIANLGHGGFHIWPKGEKAGDAEIASAEATSSIDAIAEYNAAGLAHRETVRN